MRMMMNPVREIGGLAELADFSLFVRIRNLTIFVLLFLPFYSDETKSHLEKRRENNLSAKRPRHV